jgi:hypothetical protein
VTIPRIPARTTIYSGIKMRSRIEARFAAYLDRLGVPWQYEPEAFASRDGQYLPDFMVSAGNAPPIVIEVKPWTARDDPAGFLATVETTMERMEIVRASIPDAVLILAFSGSPCQLLNNRARWEIVPGDDWWTEGPPPDRARPQGQDAPA